MKMMTVIVTGASRGIGRAITDRCLREGRQVVGVSRNKQHLKRLSRELKHERFIAMAADISRLKDVQKIFLLLKKKKILPTGLVNNAGIYLAKTLMKYQESQIDHVLNTNLKGPIYMSLLFAKLLRTNRKRGVIVNMSSVSGIEGSSDAIYGASKAGLNGLTSSCALNFAPFIRVNAIAPGVVKTDMAKQIPKWRLKEYREFELIKSPILAEDVANAAWFLLSNQSAHLTGTILDINNGCYIRS